jgi:hypothetical protein
MFFKLFLRNLSYLKKPKPKKSRNIVINFLYERNQKIFSIIHVKNVTLEESV